MIVDRPGKVTDRVTLLGRRESCVYWLDGGDECAILGGGMAYVIPDVADQIRTFDLEEDRLTRIVVHHVHFDHVGLLPFFKARFPRAELTGSAKAREKLDRPEVTASLLSANRGLLALAGLEDRAEEYGLSGGGVTVDRVARDGEEISLGDLTLRFIEVPGHSSCSLAVYVLEEKALFASDAGGIPFEDLIFASANANFDQYQASLEKMAALDVEAHLAEHYGAYIGDDGRGFMARSMESARLTRQAIEESLARTADVDKTAEEILAFLSREAAGYFLPRDVMDIVLRQMIRFVADRRGE